MSDENRQALLDQYGITEEIVNEKTKFKVNPIIAAVIILLVELGFLLLVLLAVGGPL